MFDILTSYFKEQNRIPVSDLLLPIALYPHLHLLCWEYHVDRKPLILEAGVFILRLSVNIIFCPIISRSREFMEVQSSVDFPLNLQLKDLLRCFVLGILLVFIIVFSMSLDSFYQRSKKKCLEKFCSDSSSDCGSSSGSVRASRGSWGSWSSTSSSDGDKKPMITARHFLPSSKFCSYHLCTVVSRVLACLPNGKSYHGMGHITCLL